MPLPDAPLRSSKATPLAAIVTAGLLILMTIMIAVDDGSSRNDSPPLTIHIFEGDMENEEIRKTYDIPPAIRPQRKPIPTVSITQDPQPDVQSRAQIDHPIRQDASTPSVTYSLGDVIGQGSGDQIAMIEKRSPPQYPRGLRERGVEGYVDLSFDITAEGTTANIRVTDAWPKRVFDKSAIQALKKWRYKPQRVDGKPVNVSGATTRIIFTLDKP